MTRTRKIIISIIIGIIAILGFHTNVNAITSNLTQGGTISLGYQEYCADDDLYCLEHTNPLHSDRRTYKVVKKIIITGNKSTNKDGGNPVIHVNNARLAYILNDNSNKTERKNAIWNFMGTWMTNVGSKYKANGHNGLGYLYNKVKGTPQDLDQESRKYAQRFKADGDLNNIEDKTNKDKIKVEVSGNNIIIGPFNWEFAGEIQNIVVKDKNNNTVDAKIKRYKGNELKTFANISNLKSGQNFYISVPYGTDVSKLKVTGKEKVDVFGATLYFLEASGTYQNLMKAVPTHKEQPITTDFEYDIDAFGDLKIVKINADNPNVKLPNVKFQIKNKETGKYVHQSANGTITYENTPQDFYTDSNGVIELKYLLVGTYQFYEISNPNYGYQLLTVPEEIKVEAGATSTDGYTIKNKQIYVKLSGYVWLDRLSSSKPQVNNNLYNQGATDNEDKLLNGIIVRLKDKNGTTIKEARTSEGGAYLFTDVLIEKLGDYYIEFEYDGLTYTNEVPNLNADNGSKSAEKEADRTNFNKKFSVVEGNGNSSVEARASGISKDENGNKVHDISYTLNDNKATLNNVTYDDSKATDTSLTLSYDGHYHILADTTTAGYSILNHFTYGQEEIKYINLGLYERDQPNIGIAKDIENVKVVINGYSNTYKYAMRYTNMDQASSDDFNVGVKFGEKYGIESYSRAIYKADYEYINENNRDSELQVYVTYKIMMKNTTTSQSGYTPNLTTKVNSIVDYYDKDYNLVAVGSNINSETGEITDDLKRSDPENYGDYQKVTIYNNTEIAPQAYKNIYVQFKLSREELKEIIDEKGYITDEGNQAVEMKNIAEVNSYSTMQNGVAYAGIDVNSNPGNAIPGDKDNTYEDDTDASPALRLEVTGARELSGTVFEDIPVSESGEDTTQLMTAKIRQGNGIYDEGTEKGIGEVDITLTEKLGSGKVYNAKTDANGNFTITDFIPGDYTLTYTWGDQTYTVQDYKGTVYNSNRDQNDKEWYKKDVETRYTDALDDYNTRKEIDAQAATPDTSDDTITKMNSTTPTMGIGVELDPAASTTQSKEHKYTYHIINVDFGIVERARQVLDITKRVSGIKVILANGQTLMDATIDENGKLQGDSIKGLTYMGPINGDNGMVKAEIDNELIQGATIQIEYTIDVANKGELDYDSENYYKYGIEEGNKITMTPSGVYDYLDSQMVLDTTQEENGNWEIVSSDEYNNTYTSPTIIETYFNDGKTTETREDGTEVTVYKWESARSEYQTLFTEWGKDITQTRTIRDSKLSNKTILHNANLEGELEPGGHNIVHLYSSKLLSNAEEIDLNNDIEITEINRVAYTGRMPDVVTSYVYDKGETVVITPPTGESQNYIVPIVVGMTALIVLGAGVVIIKKKVLDK